MLQYDIETKNNSVKVTAIDLIHGKKIKKKILKKFMVKI